MCSQKNTHKKTIGMYVSNLFFFVCFCFVLFLFSRFSEFIRLFLFLNLLVFIYFELGNNWKWITWNICEYHISRLDIFQLVDYNTCKRDELCKCFTLACEWKSTENTPTKITTINNCCWFILIKRYESKRWLAYVWTQALGECTNRRAGKSRWHTFLIGLDVFEKNSLAKLKNMPPSIELLWFNVIMLLFQM